MNPRASEPEVARTPAPERTAALQQQVGNQATARLLRTGARGGAALPTAVRSEFETSFGTSFSDVRVHLDDTAARAGARAVTRGEDLFFRPRAFDAGSARGRFVLGHELAHVVQQRSGRVRSADRRGVNADPGLEREASEAGARAARGEPAGLHAPRSAAPVAPVAQCVTEEELRELEKTASNQSDNNNNNKLIDPKWLASPDEQARIDHKLGVDVDRVWHDQRGSGAPPPSAAARKYLAIDAKQARADHDELFRRIKDIPELNTEQFKVIVNRYVNGAIAKDEQRALPALEEMLTYLDERRTFEVGSDIFPTLGTEENPVTVDEAAELATQNTVLWSKLNKWMTIETVSGGRGISLEASLAGSLFDGLTFGMDYGKGHAIIRQQWKRVSQTFVKHAVGVAHAQVFEGIHPYSVLTTTEWPKIEHLMQEGIVSAFVIHVFQFDPVEKLLVEIGQRTLHHPDEWYSLPSVMSFDETTKTYTDTVPVLEPNYDPEKPGPRNQLGPSYKTLQNEVQQSEDQRHAAMVKSLQSSTPTQYDPAIAAEIEQIRKQFGKAKPIILRGQKKR